MTKRCAWSGISRPCKGSKICKTRRCVPPPTRQTDELVGNRWAWQFSSSFNSHPALAVPSSPWDNPWDKKKLYQEGNFRDKSMDELPLTLLVSLKHRKGVNHAHSCATGPVDLQKLSELLRVMCLPSPPVVYVLDFLISERLVIR